MGFSVTFPHQSSDELSPAQQFPHPCLECVSIILRFYGSARSSVLLGFPKQRRGSTWRLGLLSSPNVRSLVVLACISHKGKEENLSKC